MSIASKLDGYARALLMYYPKNDRADGEGSGFTAPAYGLLNVYLGLQSPAGAWDARFFVRNLTNTDKTLTYGPNAEVASVGPINLNFGQSGYYRASTTPLRELGLTLRYAFGSR
jgi:iron complex outermembrane recepter protein